VLNIPEVIADLRKQRDCIALAILALENVSTSRPRWRGRPRMSLHAKTEPANHALVTTSPTKTMVAAN